MRKNKLSNIIDQLEEGLLDENRIKTGFNQLDNSLHLNRKSGTSILISSNPYYHSLSLLIPILLRLAKDGKSVMLFLNKTSVTEIIGKFLGVPASVIHTNAINNEMIEKSGIRHLPIYLYDSIACESQILDEIESNYSNVIVVEGVDSFDEEDFGSRYFLKSAKELVKGFNSLLMFTSASDSIEDTWLPFIDYQISPRITGRTDTGSLFIDGAIDFQSNMIHTSYSVYYDIFKGVYISPEAFNSRGLTYQDSKGSKNE